MEKLDWVYGERGGSSHLISMAASIRPGKYDLVFLLAGFSGHDWSSKLAKACRNSGIRLIYLTRGYSVSQVAEAIRQQAMPRVAKFAE